MEELEKVQFAAELAAQIFSLDATQRQLELDVVTVPNDMDPTERGSLEEAMLQSVIETSLVEADDDIIQTDSGVAPLCTKPVSDADE